MKELIMWIVLVCLAWSTGAFLLLWGIYWLEVHAKVLSQKTAAEWEEYLLEKSLEYEAEEAEMEES